MLYPLIRITKDIYMSKVIGISDVDVFMNNSLLLFKRFKKAYENKDIHALADTISEHFSGSYYGAKTKIQFLNLMRKVFESMPLLINPHLVIEVTNIETNTEYEFKGIIKLKAMIEVVFIPIPWQYDSGKVLCQAKPEGNLKYWRITSLESQ
ncbi:hypothetical protein [Cyanobacterium aponinum]|uniref:hypothetical protein n=1 Tax=Cyanobacterium aponinum TaxID=379064 RepID=UPI000C12ABA5|nr:hypothetical protein [Cyanobacterium aponinum]PHV61032.1 hypothetical protein CSQ80_17785 [Cyanobacterium aponinum IPPAS B-1201]